MTPVDRRNLQDTCWLCVGFVIAVVVIVGTCVYLERWFR